MLRCIISQDNRGYECISPDDLPDRKPIPTPRSRKRNLNQDKKGQVKDNAGPLPPFHENISLKPIILNNLLLFYNFHIQCFSFFTINHQRLFGSYIWH